MRICAVHTLEMRMYKKSGLFFHTENDFNVYTLARSLYDCDAHAGRKRKPNKKLHSRVLKI